MIINPYRFSSGGGSGSSLLTGLDHWWDMDEGSGNAIDATGNQDLTDNNTVGVSSGNAPDGGDSRLFTAANSESFSASAGAILSSGTAMTIGFWMYATNASGTNKYVWHHAVSGFSGLLVPSNGYLYQWFNGLQTRYKFTNNHNAWHCIIATSDNTTPEDKLYLDGAEVTTGPGNKGAAFGSAVFEVGQKSGGAYFDGNLCSMAIWNRVLTSDELTEFYNSGTNLRYADLSA